MGQTGKPRVVVLGGGFGGVETAIGLSKAGGLDVVLVSERDFLYLFPITIWIPTRTIPAARTHVPLAQIAAAHGFEVLIDSVERIEPADNAVLLSGQTLVYDYLVLATGASKPKLPGGEHALSLCAGPNAALSIQAQIDALLRRGRGKIAVGFGGNPKDGSAMRGGPAFETVFNIDHLLRSRGVRDNFELTFFAPMATPGQRMGAAALAKIGPMIAARQIRQQVGVPITGFRPDGVDFEGGVRLDADVTLFIPGAVGHPLAQVSGLPVNAAGFVKIDANTLVEGSANIYAVGDVAELSGPDWRAKQGHVAEAMAHAAAHNIAMASQGRNERIGYAEHVSILCLMDTGSGGVLVYRSTKRQFAINLPIVGHWLKRGWGFYSRNTKLRRFPRLPGL